MEVQDSNYDLLESVLITSSPVGFKDAEVAILLGNNVWKYYKLCENSPPSSIPTYLYYVPY